MRSLGQQSSAFADDHGEADPALRVTLASAYSGGNEPYLRAVAALCAARLLLPIVATGDEGGDGPDPDRHAEMAAVLVRSAAGDTAVPVFTGLDALTHALEAWVSPQATDFTDALAEKAARLVFRALPVAIRQGDCIATRSKMHNASTLAGMAFSQAGLGLNHAIAHQLGGQFHLPHGLANALLLTAVIRFNAGEPRAAKRYARLARACRFCPPAAGEQEAFQALLTAVETLKQQCAIPTLKGALQEKYPLFLSRIPAMVPAALADATLRTNPRPVDGAAIAQLLESLQ